MLSLVRLLPLAEGERRRSQRFLIPPGEKLVVGVAAVGGDRPRTLTGHVRDMSVTGLSLFLPPGESCDELIERGLLLAVVLTLPSGVITLHAEVAHCAAPGERHARGGYLVGVRVVKIDDEDHRRLAAYISERS